MNYNFSCDHKLAIENLVNFGSRSESKWKMGSRWKRFGTATLFATNKMSAALTPWNKNQTEGKAKVVAAGWGTELIKILCHTSHLAPGWFVKKRLNRRTDTWRNGCFGKNGWSSGSHHTKPTTLPKWMFFQKLFFKSSAIWLVRHSMFDPPRNWSCSHCPWWKALSNMKVETLLMLKKSRIRSGTSGPMYTPGIRHIFVRFILSFKALLQSVFFIQFSKLNLCEFNEVYYKQVPVPIMLKKKSS